MKYFLSTITVLSVFCMTLNAQKYSNGLIDRAAAVVGAELITLSDLESEVRMMDANGYTSDRNIRCDVLEQMMENKMFLVKARIDSLNVNSDMVEAQLNQRLDQVKTGLGGEDKVEEYFHKPVYRLRQEWRSQLEEMSLIQQAQQDVASKIPELTPYDVKQFLDTVDRSMLPMVPIKYRMSQICIYPDREAAAMAVKEKLLAIRERIINGERFSTLARLYSEDPGSARKGGELGMASKSIFWPSFSDAAMALKPGIISQIVETPDGFHLIEVLEKKNDMFNARHILLKPRYTSTDREKAFARLDSLRTIIDTSSKLTFELAARLFSEDPASRTNGGLMSDPNTGSAFFEIDQIKPQDYNAVKSLKEGGISEPIESRDNEGRDGNLVYKIVRLDKVVPAHQATFENDYSELLKGVEMLKKEQAMQAFVESRIKETYVVIDPMFKDCSFRRQGWADRIRKD